MRSYLDSWFLGTKCRREAPRRVGERKVGSACLMAIEFLFGIMDKFWK